MFEVSDRLSALVFTILLLCIVVHACSAQEPPLKEELGTQEQINIVNREMALLRGEMALIKERQELLVESVERNLRTIYMVFAIAGAVFTLAAVTAAVHTARRQARSDRRRDYLEDLYIDRRDKDVERRAYAEDEHMKLEQEYMRQIQDVMGSFSGNITTVNSLIETVQKTYDYQEQLSKKLSDRIEKIDDQLAELEKAQQVKQESFRSKVDSLNIHATQVFGNCNLDRGDRLEFTTAENRNALKSLASDLDTLDRIGDIEGLISPVALFLSALSHFINTMNYEESARDLILAREYAKQQLESTSLQYGGWSSGQIRRNLGTIINETSYHLGIINYNLGRYESARQEFSTALEGNPLDLRSRIYIPELMFFEDDGNPVETEEEYEAVEKELEALSTEQRRQIQPSWEKHYSDLKIKQGNFYLEKLYSTPVRKAVWGEYESSEKAVDCFREAYKTQPKSRFAGFSLAQGIQSLDRSGRWEDLESDKLFSDAFRQFRDGLASTTEPILLSLLNYCAAISCFYAKIPGEMPNIYLAQARQHLQYVPGNIRVFSPISKINMDHGRLLEEMSQFQELCARSV